MLHTSADAGRFLSHISSSFLALLHLEENPGPWDCGFTRPHLKNVVAKFGPQGTSGESIFESEICQILLLLLASEIICLDLKLEKCQKLNGIARLLFFKKIEWALDTKIETYSMEIKCQICFPEAYIMLTISCLWRCFTEHDLHFAELVWWLRDSECLSLWIHQLRIQLKFNFHRPTRSSNEKQWHLTVLCYQNAKSGW